MKKYLSLVLVLLSAIVLVGCKKTTQPEAAKVYTYRLATNSLPTAWNVHTYQSNDANTVLGYTEDSLYTFDYNEAKDGYKIVPSMAKSAPQDVTAQHVGEYGIQEGDTAKAYKIELRDDLKFDNGDAITAETFVESVKRLLNPEAANYRADSLYSGNLKIVNAQAYLKGGTYGSSDSIITAGKAAEYLDPASFTEDEDGYLQPAEGRWLYFDLNDGNMWSSNPLTKYADYGYMTKPNVYVMDEQGRYLYYLEDEAVLARQTIETFVKAEGEDAITAANFADALEAGLYVKVEGEYVELEEDATFDATAEYYFEVDNYKWFKVEDGSEITVEDPSDPKGALTGDYAKAAREYDNIQAWVDLLESAGKDQVIEKMKRADYDNLVSVVAYLQVEGTTADYAAACTAAGKTNFGAEGNLNYAYVEAQEFLYFGKIYDKVDFATVGFKADGNSIVIYLTKSLDGFYLNYSLCTSFSLVHIATYDSCENTSTSVYTNSYGTSKETYVGFGPYKISSYVQDSEVKFERNPYWWGYTSGEHEYSANGQYMTTNVSVKQVSSEATRLEMFLKGELDSYGLQAADMADYQSSKFTYYTEGDSTWFVALNPSDSGLASAQAIAQPVNAGNAVYKTILTVKKFRQALSFSVDRAAYALALDPLGGVAKALYGNMIISDPDNGVAYRTTEQAKDVILKFWGLYDEVGEGKTYADKDAAIASITGYDLAGSKVLFQEAFDEWAESGAIDAETLQSGKWEIQLMIGQPGSGSSTYYNKGYEYLSKVWTDAVKGTSLEGHLTFKQSQPLGSTGFSKFLKDNSVDVLFGVGWTGSALDPYGLMEAYVSPNYQYDPAWDTDKTSLDIELTINGVKATYRASVLAWGKECLNGEEIEAVKVVNGEATEESIFISAGTTVTVAVGEAEAQPVPEAENPVIRLDILAAVEGAVLEQYDMIPINLDSSANLKGMKIVYGTEEFVYGVGRGGVQYMTYKQTDAEWDAYVKAQGGTLNYK